MIMTDKAGPGRISGLSLVNSAFFGKKCDPLDFSPKRITIKVGK
jgi:hypothetical protein